MTRVNFFQKKKESIPQLQMYQTVTKQGKRSYNEDRFICKPKIHSPFILNRHQKRQ